MNRFDLMRLSEDYIRETLRGYLRSDTAVYLYGSRARGDAAWNSDYDLWVDGLPDHADLLERVLVSIRDAVGQDDGAR
jgi:predicted nucleotidyltransferase